MEDLAWIMAKRNALLGVASSQLLMGHWTPEFYKERVALIEREFREALEGKEK